MGKKKADKAKDKLPKTIAGVKVPKELRKGGQFAKFMGDPLVREIALAALAAGLAARKDARRSARKAVADVADAGAEGSGWVKAALGAAAVEAGRMVIDALEESGSRKKAGRANGSGDDSESGRSEAERAS